MVLDCFERVWKRLGGFGRVWEGLGRVGRGGEGWGGLRVTGGGIFYIFFSGFAIDRSKKYMKVIKNYMKLMRLTPRQLQTTAPQPPVTMVSCMGPYNPIFIIIFIFF